MAQMNKGENVYIVQDGKIIPATYVQRIPDSALHVVKVNNKDFEIGGYWICDTYREAQRFAQFGLNAYTND